VSKVVAQPELNIGRCASARVRERFRIAVEADDTAGRSDAFAQQRRDAARAAADVEACPARPDADLVEHGACGRRHGLRLGMQPLDLAGAALERIVSGKRFAHCSSAAVFCATAAGVS
jgi:hypothetical protein